MSDHRYRAVPPGLLPPDVLASWSRPGPDGCRLWAGRLDSAGRPAIRVAGTRWAVARLVYRDRHGEIPRGRQVTPACGMRLCVAADHLHLAGQHRTSGRAPAWHRRAARLLATIDPTDATTVAADLIATSHRLGLQPTTARSLGDLADALLEAGRAPATDSSAVGAPDRPERTER